MLLQELKESGPDGREGGFKNGKSARLQWRINELKSDIRFVFQIKI